MVKRKRGLSKLVVGGLAARSTELVRPSTGKSTTVSGRTMTGWMGMALEEKYRDRRPEWGDPRPVEKGWAPSSLSKDCDRELVISVLGHHDPIDTGLLRIFDAGHDIEARWIKRFQAMGLWLPGGGVRRRREQEPIINWMSDLKVRHAFEEGRQFLVEVKSINANGFRALPPTRMDPDDNWEALRTLKGGRLGPRVRGYLTQIQIYLYEDPEPEGLLLFDCKDNSEFAEYFLTVRPEFIEALYARLMRLNEYRKRLAVPPCTCEKPSGLFCKHRTSKELDLAEIKNLTEVPL